jgi:uncharacterized lipoprotein YmbA
MLRFAFPALLFLAACGGEGPRDAMDPAPLTEGAVKRLRVSTLEVRDVSLPAYAEDSQILLEGKGGALTPVKNAVWADEPVRSTTILLADRLGRASTATVAAEPWPLETPAQAAVHVRVSEMVARETGQFSLRGQFAVSSYDRVIPERIRRFDILVPLADTSPAGIARASGVALGELADTILAELSR